MKSSWLLTAGSMVLGTLLASDLLAQARPMPPDPFDPQTQPAPASAVPQPALPAANDYPAAEVQAVPALKARFVAARAEYDIAQSSIVRVIDQLKEDFEFSADYATAVDAEKTAYTRYASARDRVLRQIASASDYQTLKHFCDDLSDKLFNLKANPAANRAEIVATAQLKLAYAKKLSVMESDALLADSETQEAKAKLIDAGTRLTQMRLAFQRSVRRDQKFLAARKDVDDARVARVAAAAMLTGALEARDIALDYAYWLHRSDPYTWRYTGDSYYDSYYNTGYGGFTTISDPYNRVDAQRRGRWH